MRAYHLLSSEHALSDIALQRIKIATFSDLNDPFELLALSLGLESVRNRPANTVFRGLAKSA